MDLILHLGAHGTDMGIINAWLRRNAAVLEAQGIALPYPRPFLRAISEALAERPENRQPQDEEALLRAMGASRQRQRMVVSAQGLLGPIGSVLGPRGFYGREVARRIYGLQVLFPRCRLRFLLAVGRPGTVLPELLSARPDRSLETVLSHLGDEILPWSQLVRTLRRQAPQVPLTVWRHEQLSTVWPAVLRELVGPGRTLPLEGMIDFALRDLSARARLLASRHLVANPPANATQLQKIARDFGERYGFQPQRNDANLDLPGWARQQMAHLDLSYETEWTDIAHTPGVRALG